MPDPLRQHPLAPCPGMWGNPKPIARMFTNTKFLFSQVDGEESISLALSFLRLPCATQYIKVRDGPSLSSTLLVELNGGGLILKGAGVPVVVDSTGGQLLVEFSAGDGPAGNATQEASPACTGGFMANVQQRLGE